MMAFGYCIHVLPNARHRKAQYWNAYWYHEGYICNGKPILPHANLKPHLYSESWWSIKHCRVSTQNNATKKRFLKQKPRSADAIAVVFVEETEHSFCIFDLQTLSREPASRYRRCQPHETSVKKVWCKASRIHEAIESEVNPCLEQDYTSHWDSMRFPYTTRITDYTGNILHTSRTNRKHPRYLQAESLIPSPQ